MVDPALQVGGVQEHVGELHVGEGSGPKRPELLDIRAEILEKGVDERGRFRQAYENDDLDASLLLLPIMGFLPPDD